MSDFRGHFFDGRTAAARPVLLRVAGGRLSVLAADDMARLREVALGEVDVSEPCRHAPLLVHLHGGGTVEVADARGLAAALDHGGRPAGLVPRLQQRWPASLAALALLVATLVLGYTHGLPAAAKWLAFELPAEFGERLGEEVLATLDATQLEASDTAPERRDAVRRLFAEAVARAAPEQDVRLVFRRGDDGAVVGGFNAFALPGGTVVLLDGLVDNTDDAQVLGVLAHELGHQAHHHSMRNLLQAAGLGVVAGLVWGDVSAIVANAPVLLGVLSYTRDFEREADAYAARFLHANGLTVEPLVEVLQEIARLHGGGTDPGLLGSHPGVDERIDFLREVQARRSP